MFVLMSQIVKRMNQRQRPEFSARLAVDRRCSSRAPRRSLRFFSAEDEPADPKALALARGQKQSRLIAAPITQVSNRAATTFNTEQLGYGVLSTSPPLNPARTGCLLLDSVEVPALRFDDVDVQVRDIDVACAQTLGRELAGIGTAAGVGDFVAASMRQRERGLN